MGFQSCTIDFVGCPSNRFSDDITRVSTNERLGRLRSPGRVALGAKRDLPALLIKLFRHVTQVLTVMISPAETWAYTANAKHLPAMGFDLNQLSVLRPPLAGVG